MQKKHLFNAPSLIWGVIILFIWVNLASCSKDDPSEPYKNPFSKVNAFIIDSEGTKLLATDVGLVSLNEATGEYEILQNATTISTYNDLKFNTSSSPSLWIASNSGALNYTSQTLLTPSNSGLHNGVVRHLNFDNDERSYFATPNGISILENDKWIKSLGLNDLYLRYEITDMASASNKYNYVTTKGGGVERFEVGVDGISGATVFDTDWSKLKSNNVNTVFIDDTIQAYGTDYGVAMHYSEYTKWDWETYTVEEGLIGDTVLSIVKDKQGSWWYGTTNGLSKRKDTQWTNYSVETHGILSNNIKFLAIDIDGSLWFASDKGLSHYLNETWHNY